VSPTTAVEKLFRAKEAQRSSCSSYVGQSVAPTTIDKVAAAASKVPSIKGEFETTEQFEMRQGVAMRQLAPQYIVSKTPDRDHITYDADSGKLLVSEYAFDNLNVDYDSVFGFGTPFFGSVKHNHFRNIDVVMSETETTTGSYVGSNAFGASLRVARVLRTTKAIFEREAAFHESLFIDGASRNHVIGELPLTPETARRVKKTASVALVIAPMSPFFAYGVKSWGAPTIDDARDVEQPISVVIADIQCGLLLDATNKVLGAYATL
jgi:hypothetical protein